ncbi:nucleoside hydrolase [Photobacterium sanctipauli]|uniref:Nucleoside hydrolase n=1 Tax=Photobacterium sanctipauli TaxID=1342794 RepID=A0A2T3NWF7_9GAMM|nr:nucleoside hydrolase [Photobacterium sanctipauli]PSW20559.1 nucleoside hydrolase [Photobacterium sanctipauli]
MEKVIIDCDAGMDDSIALILAAKSKELDILGITTVSGNLHVDETTRNTLVSLELINRPDIPVYKGQAKPLIRELPSDPFSHGDDGLGNNHHPAPTLVQQQQHAVDFIIDTVKANPGEVTLLTLAPLTNIALAFIKAPEIIPQIKKVVAIAGSFGTNRASFENATGDNPQSEWNVYVDPDAAKVVFESGVKFQAVGLDVATHFDVNFDESDIVDLENSAQPEAKHMAKMMRFVLGRDYQSYCVLIDSMAVAAVIDPSLIKTLTARVAVETQGQVTLGQTVADFRHSHTWHHLPEIEVSVEADYKKFMNMVKERVMA